jgi:hypothetical protein
MTERAVSARPYGKDNGRSSLVVGEFLSPHRPQFSRLLNEGGDLGVTPGYW